MPYLEAKNLSKSFRTLAGGTREVLCNLDLSAEAGQSVAITGASGAGKSTLLHILAGLEKADAGTVRVAGVHAATARQVGSIGFVFQSARLLPDLTAQENVGVRLLLQPGWTKRAAWQKAAVMLAQVGLADQTGQMAGQLSGGEQQRVSLARALAGAPRLLLADEPTGNLDEPTGAQILSLLLNYVRQSKATLVLATHNEEWARQCERWLVLRQGALAEASRK